MLCHFAKKHFAKNHGAKRFCTKQAPKDISPQKVLLNNTDISQNSSETIRLVTITVAQG